MTMLRVRGSLPREYIRSPQPTSSIEPIEIKALKPTNSRRLQSRTAVQSAPLWLMKPTLPGRAMAEAKVALSPVRGLITPRQLGPMMRMLPRRASNRVWRSSSSPAGTDLLEARRNTDAGLDAFLRALVDNTGHGGRRCHDHGQIHLLGYLRDMLVGLDAKY